MRISIEKHIKTLLLEVPLFSNSKCFQANVHIATSKAGTTVQFYKTEYIYTSKP